MTHNNNYNVETYGNGVCVCVCVRRPSHLSGQEAEGANGRAAGEEAEPAGVAEHTIG